MSFIRGGVLYSERPLSEVPLYTCTVHVIHNNYILLLLTLEFIHVIIYDVYSMSLCVMQVSVLLHYCEQSEENIRSVGHYYHGYYRIAGKFGGDFNLVLWRIDSKPPN